MKQITQKNKMTADEQLVLEIIAGHRGRDNAVTTGFIASRTGYNIRLIRIIVKSLIENHHIPIAATTNTPYGYYIPQTVKEVVEYKRNLQARINSINSRLIAFEKSMKSSLFREPSLFDKTN